MSPSKFVRKVSAALTGVGTVAIVAALSIGLTGWPPAEAFAESGSQEVEAVSLSLASATDSTPTASAVTTAAATASGTRLAQAKVKKITKVPRVKKQVKKVKKKAKARKRVKSIGWKSARVSWYGPGLYGHTMAGGGKLTQTSMVVAHRSLPFGTKIQFSYKGRSCVAVVRDRGPYVSGRVFDLGPGTAKKLGFGGVGSVRYRVVR